MYIPEEHSAQQKSFIERVIWFFLHNKLAVALLILAMVGGGIWVAPFDWHVPFLLRDPVPVDAIPDLGENQQIVFTEWHGRSPVDVENQLTYPLTTALLGIPGVKTLRSYSMFGFSAIYVIFEERIDFYWSRSRILEKLSSLPSGLLPEGVQPHLGPDATPLGQIFWYALEGRDPQGHPTGGWNLDELRSIQDWQVRLALQAVPGVAEVSSVGGFVREYQVDVDPDAMRAHGVMLEQIAEAVRRSNRDVGAGVIEQNRVEYALRSLGFIKTQSDIEESVVKVTGHTPIRVRDVAHVAKGPQLRRGALDRGGVETVGGIVVVRFGENPLAVIRRVKEKIGQIADSLPHKTLPDGTESRVTIVPFYDRTQLIHETLATLANAIKLEILVTMLVVLLLMRHFASSMVISAVMPLAVLCSFIAMRLAGVPANIVSLAGIAIAIGTVVDMGIILCENILRHLGHNLSATTEPATRPDIRATVFEASREVGGAVLTAILTTVVGFLPVFAMEGPEGKLFKPLAFTKTFALIASLVIALTIIPSVAELFFRKPVRKRKWGWSDVAVGIAFIVLAAYWSPLGVEYGLMRNLILVGGMIGFLMLSFALFRRHYERVLKWCLDHKAAFLTMPLFLTLLGILIWFGFERVFGWLPPRIKRLPPVSYVAHQFPGLGREFMPSLDEGSFLYMPSTMPHASINEVLDVMQKQDRAFESIPGVASAVGKLGRAESPLDPAPLTMIETLITYQPRFLIDHAGRRLAFRFNAREKDFARDPNGNKILAPDGQPYLVRGKFERDEKGRLIPDRRGKPFPLWPPPLDPELNPGRAPWAGIRKPDDIWDAIVTAGKMPGVTSAPRLQPIAARLVMLQSGIRAAMGVKVSGPSLDAIESACLEIERALKEEPTIVPSTVVADRILGRPYLEIIPDRRALARYGVKLEDFQDVVEMAIGGKALTTTVEGRERYPVRIRYAREWRDSIESLQRVLIPAASGAFVPLAQVAEVRYERGPEMIKGENGTLVAYVLFDKKPTYAEVDVVEQARQHLDTLRARGELRLPPGITYTFAGNYENQVRAQKKLAVVLPLALLVIFLILYFQFRDAMVSGLIFAGIVVAWSGGFLLMWLYGQTWFLNFSVFGYNLRELFQIRPVNLSVAVWVGFLALFGIASDDGVVMCTYLNQRFRESQPRDVGAIRRAVVEAGAQRVRACLMTTATTLLALLPVLTSTGRGADILIPMAIPSFGGMFIEILTMLTAPVLYAAYQEYRLRHARSARLA